jgi:hypothetical protein
MSFRNDVDRRLESDAADVDALKAAVRALADAVDELWSDRAKAERLQGLAEEGFAQGLKGE